MENMVRSAPAVETDEAAVVKMPVQLQSTPQDICQRSPLAPAASGPLPGLHPGLLPSSSMRQRTHEDNDNQMQGSWPMPKWPPNHVSEAFESVAIKKALILSPPEIYAEIAHHGEEKAKFHWTKVALLAIVAGCYCGFGFTLCLLVGGNAPREWLEGSPGLFSLLFGAVGFPFSFTLILVCGAELFTSLCAYMTAAWWEGKVTASTCVRMWVTSWLWNFVGCAIFVGLMYASGIYHDKDWYIKVLAEKKVSHGWGETVVRGIFANWLVCIATWQANAAQDLTGKAVGIWLPISAFAMLGFEHCIANQFLIPMGIALGASVSAKQFVVNNLIPATIGNWIGGAICMATVYAFIYGRPPKQIAAWMEARRGKSDATAVVSSPAAAGRRDGGAGKLKQQQSGNNAW